MSTMDPDQDEAPPAKGAPPPAIHTRFSRGLVLLALGTGALALALGNPVLLMMAATIAAFLHAARAGWPGGGSLVVDAAPSRVQRGRTVEVRTEATTGPSPFAYWLHVPLPAAFTLEQGSNVSVLPPGAVTREAFVAGAPKRGLFRLGPATLTALHPHLLAPATRAAFAEGTDVVVEPRTKALRKAKQLRGRARVLLGEDRARRGPGGMDFREIREYHRGDPLKAMNWKATAKRSVGELELMVNSHEPEARKDIWFFLDVSAEMEVGTSLDNALEDGIEVTLALVRHFVSRGHRVGGTTFNGPAPMVFYTESGTRQHLAIARGLAQAVPGSEREGLPAAVERVKGFLGRERPTVFVITRPDLDPEGLQEGARRIQQHSSGRRAQPVYVLAPRPAMGSESESLARHLRDLEGADGALRSSGRLRIVSLHHGVASLDAALSKGVLAR
jgi:uncharacterized protein (DUF58 family)